MAHPLEHQNIVLHFLPSLMTKRVLDCGCGKGIWGYILRSIKNGEDSWMVGVDLARRYLAHVKRFHIYDDIVLCDARRMPFAKKSFDIVLASEILEHMPKKHGLTFLQSLQEIATERVVVTTPNGYGPQEALDDVTSQTHLSGWTVGEFRRAGFRVNGYGFRFLRSRRTPYLYEFLDNVLTPLTFILPQLAGFLVATWTSDGRESRTRCDETR